jgi:hypothetical protein
MSRRICLLFLAVSFALAAPAASLAQSSSQAQYQGVAPETSTPVTGSGGSPGAGGSAATTSNGSGTSATGTGGSNATGKGTTSGASGNGGSGASAPATTSGGVTVVTPEASSDTAPFSGGDFVWIVLACAGLAGLGLALRRATRSPAGT